MSRAVELIEKYKDDSNLIKEGMLKAYVDLVKEEKWSITAPEKLRPIWELKIDLRDRIGKDYFWYLEVVDVVESVLNFFRDPAFATEVGFRETMVGALEILKQEGVDELMYEEGCQKILETIDIILKLEQPKENYYE